MKQKFEIVVDSMYSVADIKRTIEGLKDGYAIDSIKWVPGAGTIRAVNLGELSQRMPVFLYRSVGAFEINEDVAHREDVWTDKGWQAAHLKNCPNPQPMLRDAALALIKKDKLPASRYSFLLAWD
jgi:hypothetical protein